MPILREFRPLLRVLEAYNVDSGREHNWRSILRTLFLICSTTLIALSIVVNFLLGAWYLIETNVDLKMFVVAVPLLISFLQIELTFIAMIIKNRNISETISQLQRVVDQRRMTSEHSTRIYERAEDKHSSFTSILIRLIIADLIVVFSLAAMSPISYAICGYPLPQQWRLPLETHSLIGRTNYIGFFVDYLIELCGIVSLFIAIISSASIYVGMYLYMSTMVKDIKMQIMSINSIQSNNDQDKAWSIYIQEINLHVEAIGVAKSLSDMMEVILFNITFTCTIVIAFNLFVIELNDGLEMETLIALLDLCLILVLTFVYFYLSERITSDLLEIGDIFYDSPWYRLATKRQKLLILSIQRAQREVRMTGLGLFDCSLPVFWKIIRTAASYFLIIRQFK